MAAAGKGWKIFGIIIIAALVAGAIAVGAFFIGRGCEKEEGGGTTATTRSQPAATEEEEEGGAEEAGGAAGPEAAPEAGTSTGAATTERYVTGEGEGSTPCIGGTRTTTRTTYWSDGSTDTVTVTEPCTP